MCVIPLSKTASICFCKYYKSFFSETLLHSHAININPSTRVYENLGTLIWEYNHRKESMQIILFYKVFQVIPNSVNKLGH